MAKGKMSFGKIVVVGSIGLFLIVILFPFYWMIISSMKGFSELFAYPPRFLPESFNLKTYWRVLFEEGFILYLKNSFYVALLTATLNLTLACLGAYAIARLKFKGKAMMMRSILLVYMFPGILLIIPLFAMLAKVGFIDNLNGLILTYLAQTLPVSIYMLAAYFRTVPEEIEEAGLVDGCSRLGVITKITLPLSVPAMASVGIYTFMIAWNEFLYALVFLYDSNKFTMPLGLVRLYQSYHTSWDLVMAASVIITVPIIVLFLAFEKYLEQGLVAGGVKG
jgi:multiple sugar transport system permease protein